MPTSNGITTYLIVVYKEGNNEGKDSRKKEVTTDGSWPIERDGLRAYSFPEYAHTTGETPRSGFAQGLFQSTFKVIKSSLAHHLKTTNLESSVAVYIPLLPHTIGFKIGFGFIPNFPEGIRFLARIKFNGTLVAQVCIKPQQQPNGVISRILAEVPTGHKSKDTRTLQEFEFEFAPKSGIFRSTADEGGDIEISWHRVLGSALSKSEDINRIKSFKEKFQIKLKPAGEAVDAPQRKFYLVDPIDEPFASQKWYYRTARSLQESQIMSPDHDLYTQLPPIGDRGSLQHHVDRKSREKPQNQKRRISVSGPFYLHSGLSLDSCSTDSPFHHDITATAQGARRYKSTRELKRRPNRDRQENFAGDQTRSRRFSLPSIDPSMNVDAGSGPVIMGSVNTVLLPSPGNHKRNLTNSCDTDLGEFTALRANNDGVPIQNTSTDENGQAQSNAPHSRPANKLYRHDNVQFGYGLSSSPIPESDDISILSTVDKDFIRSGLTAAPHEQYTLSTNPPTPSKQTQTCNSTIPLTPASPVDGVSYPVMTPGSHNLPVIEPGDRSDLFREKFDNMSPYNFLEKSVVLGFSPEKDETSENRARSPLMQNESPAENITSCLATARFKSPKTATPATNPSAIVRCSRFDQIEGSGISRPTSLSLSRQCAPVGHEASNSGGIPFSLGLADATAVERQVSEQVHRRVYVFDSQQQQQQQVPPPSCNFRILHPTRPHQIPMGFCGGMQRAQSQMKGMVRSPSKTASLFKEGVASVRRQLGISESGTIEASGLQGADDDVDESRSGGHECKKLTKRGPAVGQPPKNQQQRERRRVYDAFVTKGAAAHTGAALEGLRSSAVTEQSFDVARNHDWAEAARIGSDDRVLGQRDAFIPDSNTGTEPKGGIDEADAESTSPCTAALRGLTTFGERLKSGQAFISKEKKEKNIAVMIQGHAVKEGKEQQKAVEKSVEEQTIERGKVKDALKLASTTAAIEANFTSQDAPRTPKNPRPVSGAARYPPRRSSLSQLRPRPLLQDSPSLTVFGGVVGRANRHYYSNTPRSHADRARQEVHIQDQAQDHIHPPPRGASHSHPSPPVIGRARLIDVPARSSPIHNQVSHGHPGSSPARSSCPTGFDDLYDVTPPGTPRRRARQSALIFASLEDSPTRGANITAAGVQIRDASNAANLFRAPPRSSPPAAPQAPLMTPVLLVSRAWPKKRRETTKKAISKGEEYEEIMVEAGDVERENHVFSSPAPGDYSSMYQM